MNLRIPVFTARLRGLFGRQRSGRELEDEIEVHVQMLTDRFIVRGMEPGDAMAAARRQFGNATLLRERYSEQRSFSIFVTLGRDLHFGLRQLQRNPMLAFVAITSLALGIGVNTAIFTATKRVLFDTLPVANPDQLRMLTWVSGPEQPVPPVWGDVGPNATGGLTGNAFSYPVLEEMRKKTDAVEGLIAFKDAPMAVTIDGHPEMINGEMISGDGLQALGVQAELGRTLDRGRRSRARQRACCSDQRWILDAAVCALSTGCGQSNFAEWRSGHDCRRHWRTFCRLADGEPHASVRSAHHAATHLAQGAERERLPSR